MVLGYVLYVVKLQDTRWGGRLEYQMQRNEEGKRGKLPPLDRPLGRLSESPWLPIAVPSLIFKPLLQSHPLFRTDAHRLKIRNKKLCDHDLNLIRIQHYI